MPGAGEAKRAGRDASLLRQRGDSWGL
uniref:Uncharacterized protein n=1 Tax=Arundo donax TaxID=35708 RepID=A0A0A9ALA4_ARUDO